MGSSNSKTKLNYEDVQNASKQSFSNTNSTNSTNGNGNSKKYAIINTLDKNCQTCLIQNTIPIQDEEDVINSILKDKYSTRMTRVFIRNTNN
jgi:hypothetical protein